MLYITFQHFFLSDLKNEYKEVERSIEKVNKEIAILQCKRQELQERRQELEVEIDVCQSSELSSKTSKRKWATNGKRSQIPAFIANFPAIFYELLST